MKVGLLLKSEVGMIDPKYTAGTERIFLQELDFLKNRNIPFVAFSRANVLGNHYIVKRLYYPLFLIRISRSLHKHKYFLYSKFVQQAFSFIAEWVYCFQCYLYTQDCDIVIAHQTPVMTLFCPAKVIVEIHNTMEFFYPHLFKGSYEKSIYIVCSQQLQRTICNSSHLTLHTQIVHHGVNTKMFSYKPLYKNIGILKLLYAGAWHEVKGLDLLLQALIELKHEGVTNISLTIASNWKLWWDDFPQVALAYKKNVEKMIHILEPQVILKDGVPYNEMPSVYQCSDLLVSPSVWEEPFGLVNIEAMSCGTPVIAFKKGVSDEILHSRQNGLLIENKTVHCLKRSLLYIVNHTENIKKWGANARKTVESLFTIQQRERSLEVVLNALNRTQVRCKR